MATGSYTVNGEESSLIDIFTLLDKVRNGEVIDNVAFVLDTIYEQGRSVWGQTLSAAELLIEQCNSQVTIYCKNVRVAAAGLENLYRHVRELGVIFFKSDKKPIIAAEGPKVIISSEDSIINSRVSKEFDYVIIDDRDANYGSGEYNKIIFNGIWKFRTGPDGELQYDNIWLLPGMTNRPGIYSVGNSHGNSEYRDALTDGLAVTGEIHSLLALDSVEDQDLVCKSR